MNRLTEKQRAVLDWIRAFVERESVSPTLREMAQGMRLDTKSVAQHLDRLERKGYITRRRKTSRNIRLTQGFSQGGLPLVGQIAAGQPILAEENLEARLKIDDLFGAPDGTFLLRVRGESMKGAGICDGDLVAVRAHGEVRSGDIAAVALDDEATVKRLFYEGARLRLEPESDCHETIVVDPREKEVRVIGPVVGLVRRL